MSREPMHSMQRAYLALPLLAMTACPACSGSDSAEHPGSLPGEDAGDGGSGGPRADGGSTDGAVPCTPSCGLAAAPWPSEGHDPANTRRSPYVGPHVQPRVKWMTPIGDIPGQAPTIAPDGTIYATGYKHIEKLSPTGEVVAKLDTIYGFSSVTLARDGHVVYVHDAVVVANPDLTTVQALGANTWAKWPPQIADDGTILVAGNALGAFDAGYARRWSKPGPFFQGRVTIASSLVVVHGDNDHLVHAFELGTGAEAWSSPEDNTSAHIARGDDGTIYVSGTKLTALDPAGHVRWQTDVSGGTLALAGDGTIYVSGTVGLASVSPTGGTNWTLPGTFGAPAVDRDGVVYVVSDKLYAIDPAGKTLWTLAVSSGGAPSIAEDGTLYLGAFDADTKPVVLAVGR